MKIQLENLTLERAGGVCAVNGLTLDFDSDRCAAVALLGENGAGKSSLLEGIVGLIPVHSGRILVDGMPLEKKNISQIRRKIGMVFQNSDHQLFSQTVEEDVAFGPSNLELPEEEIRNRVENALKQMNILSLARRDVTQLSGGEKRRAALAGVLAMNPEAILLDEPTAMLDPRSAREFAAYLQNLPVLNIIATNDLRRKSLSGMRDPSERENRRFRQDRRHSEPARTSSPVWTRMTSPGSLRSLERLNLRTIPGSGTYTGSRTVNTLPRPGSLSRPTEPPCAFAIA